MSFIGITNKEMTYEQRQTPAWHCPGNQCHTCIYVYICYICISCLLLKMLYLSFILIVFVDSITQILELVIRRVAHFPVTVRQIMVYMSQGLVIKDSVTQTFLKRQGMYLPLCAIGILQYLVSIYLPHKLSKDELNKLNIFSITIDVCYSMYVIVCNIMSKQFFTVV